MNPSELSFVHIDADSGTGLPLPDGWRPITDCQCLILVGLTGVGKTTVLIGLTSALVDCTLLPDRRTLTDALMIPYVLRHDKLVDRPVTDRQQRFALTRRYRELHPGGMAYTLSQISVSAQGASGLVIFDGLRGKNEVQYSASLMPNARYLMLDAPDAVRIQRLLTRQDAFDAIAAESTSASPQVVTSFAALNIAEEQELLSDEEQQAFFKMVNDGIVSVDELVSKIRIVLAERQNYDPVATHQALCEYAPERSLIMDTSILSPDEITTRAVAWLSS